MNLEELERNTRGRSANYWPFRLRKDPESGAEWIGFYLGDRCIKLWPWNEIARLERQST